MELDRRKAVFGAAIAIRLVLFSVPGLPEYLGSRIEISTPITSFKRLQEGLFLYSHNVSPYDGGVYHQAQAPLLLSLFTLLPSVNAWPVVTNLLFILADLACGEALKQITVSGTARRTGFFTSPRKDHRQDPLDVVAGYLFNPLTIASCVGRSSIVFTACSVLTAISKASQGEIAPAMLAIAMASYLSVYPILLLPPIILLCLACQSASMTTGAVDALQAQGPAADSRTNGAPVPKNQQSTISTVLLKAPKTETRSFLRAVAKCVTSFGAALWALIFVSYLLLGQSWDFLSSVYGVHVLLPDLTPNVGLWWYFFIEIFDAFREFFLGVFWLHLASYSAGLSIRLYAQPLAAVIALMGLSAVFKPYPSVGDAALFLSMLPIYSHVFPLRRYSFVGWTALAYSAFLGPAFHYLWIYAGSGNANFFYAITLVWSLGLGIIIADFIYACLRDEWEVERPEMRGREAKQI